MRHSALVLASVVALGGCMKIYPDPELPDLTVQWFEDDCRPEASTIALTLTSLDDDTVITREVACSAMELVLADIPRNRYRVEGSLLYDDGSVFYTSLEEVDLRNGFNEYSYLYFASSATIRVAWVFDMGASCASLAVDYVSVDYFPTGSNQPSHADYAPCELGVHLGFPGSSTTTLRLRALAPAGVVAVSPRSEPFAYVDGELTDLGTLTLTPCSPCPPP